MSNKQIAALVLVAMTVFSLLAIGKNLAVQGGFETCFSSQLKEASFYQKLADGVVQCHLCPRRCLLREGERGFCRVRQNIGGKLYSPAYGRPATVHLDPIEKKPFYHFLPGTKVCAEY